jgi:hypothetical protein
LDLELIVGADLVAEMSSLRSHTTRFAECKYQTHQYHKCRTRTGRTLEH